MAQPVAVIVGDSQAQGAGAYLETRLKAEGYIVKRWSKPGAGSDGVAALVSSHAKDAPDAKLVVVFSGSTESKAAANAVDDVWPTADVVWYGSSPATVITSMPTAKAVWGKQVESATYFFPKVAAEREARNKALPAMLPARFRYADWRTLNLPGAAVQPSGVVFPSQPDGIHVAGDTAKAAFAGTNWPPPPAIGSGFSTAGSMGVAGKPAALGDIALVIGLLWLFSRLAAKG